MITSKMLVVVAIVSVMSAASAQSFHPSVGGKETTTKPWAAPVGHRQPHASDVPATTMGSLDFLDPEDSYIDRKISGICRGC
ncbi:hypothetical protein [Bradyrhizobium sp. McL0616]|uniref:hypothetical protein n=1 Tax=Bradyrhizobium sp. McL0616 TaxID=3415674 RepID=UPI003CE99087